MLYKIVLISHKNLFYHPHEITPKFNEWQTKRVPYTHSFQTEYNKGLSLNLTIRYLPKFFKNIRWIYLIEHNSIIIVDWFYDDKLKNKEPKTESCDLFLSALF